MFSGFGLADVIGKVDDLILHAASGRREVGLLGSVNSASRLNTLARSVLLGVEKLQALVDN